MNNNDNNDLLNEFNNMFGDNKPQETVTPYRAVSNNNNNNNNNNLGVDNQKMEINNPNINNTQTFNSQTNYNSQLVNENVNNNLNNNIEQYQTNTQNIIPNIINSDKPDVQNIIMPEVNNFNNGNTVQTTNNVPLYDTTNSINDIKVEKKPKKNKITINKELQSVIILAVILFIFILILPFIFDLFDNLRNNIFR